MANIENINRLIELLRTEESAKRFDMEHFFGIDENIWDDTPICGTAACIAGHACLLQYPDAMISGHSGNVIVSEDFIVHPEGAAKEFLGLNTEQSHWLFYGEFKDGGICADGVITIDMAIEALEYVRDGNPVTSSPYDYVILFDQNGVKML